MTDRATQRAWGRDPDNIAPRDARTASPQGSTSTSPALSADDLIAVSDEIDRGLQEFKPRVKEGEPELPISDEAKQQLIRDITDAYGLTPDEAAPFFTKHGVAPLKPRWLLRRDRLLTKGGS